jgi:hypothetical protein
MSESIAPPPSARRTRRAGQPPEREGDNETAEFERRRSELALLLIGLDREFWKRGMSEATGHPSGTEAGVRADDEERRHVRELAGTMFRELEFRLVAFADACARLGEDERGGLAGLLRLSEAKRRAIAAMLRLPERERNALRIAFVLSEAECDALADLLRPVHVPATERSSITIIDPSVVAEGDPSAYGPPDQRVTSHLARRPKNAE